jgi:hypothetical protein
VRGRGEKHTRGSSTAAEELDAGATIEEQDRTLATSPPFVSALCRLEVSRSIDDLFVSTFLKR